MPARRKREDAKQEDLTPKERNNLAEARARRIGEAVNCMKRFFHNKPYYKATPDTSVFVPSELMLCPVNIDIVLGTPDFNEAMTIAQEEVEKMRAAVRPLYTSGILDRDGEIEFYKRIIREFKMLEIPYNYQGGILLLYLWFCEGIEFK